MKRQSQSQHDQMVQYVADYLVRNGYRNVNADLKGKTQPDLIYWKSNGQGHIPDVTAVSGTNGNESHLFEIETSDSVYDQHTEDQWELFAANAKQYKKTFWVVVPKGSENDAHFRLNQLGIQAEVWGI